MTRGEGWILDFAGMTKEPVNLKKIDYRFSIYIASYLKKTFSIKGDE